MAAGAREAADCTPLFIVGDGPGPSPSEAPKETPTHPHRKGWNGKGLLGIHQEAWTDKVHRPVEVQAQTHWVREEPLPLCPGPGRDHPGARLLGATVPLSLRADRPCQG